jgi:hypothetical protein
MANVFVPSKIKSSDLDSDTEGLENFIMNKETENKLSTFKNTKKEKPESKPKSSTDDKKEKPESKPKSSTDDKKEKPESKPKSSTDVKKKTVSDPKPKRKPKEKSTELNIDNDDEKDDEKNSADNTIADNIIAEDIQTLYKIIYHIVINNDYDVNKSYSDYVSIKNTIKTIKITYYYDLSDLVLGLFKLNNESFISFSNISLTADKDFDTAINSLINKTFDNPKSKLFSNSTIKEIYNYNNGSVIISLCKLLRCIIVSNKINDVQKYNKINKKKILEICNSMLCSYGMYDQKKINYVE